MNLFDPARPKIGERPALLGVQAIVPTLCISITESGPEVEVMTMIAPNTARWLRWNPGLRTVSVRNVYEKEQGSIKWGSHEVEQEFVDQRDFNALYMRYINDPEKVLREEFNWTYVSTAIRKPRFTLSLDDLGELEV